MSGIGSRRPRPIFTWLLITQQLIAGAAIAIPCPVAATWSGERFPCEHCGCGCQSAEQCWAHCCCFTVQQQIAWGRQNGVTVPDFVVAAAKREAAKPPKPACPHCDDQGVSHAGGPSHDTGSRNDREPGADNDRSTRWVSWLSALRCHGLTQQWQTVSASWPGDQHVKSSLVLLPRGRVAFQSCLPYLVFSPAPPTPPPKTAYADTCDARTDWQRRCC